MAIYHCDVKPVQRSKGQTTTAKMAYRAGAKIEDKRTGRTHDYTAKQGVEHKEIITPQGVNIPSREDLWNMAELAERRKDACTGREYEVNLPYELTKEQRVELCRDFARELASRHGVAVDICMHEPSKEGDQRNYHAHIMTTTRIITNDGLTDKADIEKAGRKRKDDLKQTRELWANMANKHLEKAGIAERIDHRSFKEQGKDQIPTVKMGWQATQIEREGTNSFLGDINREIKAKNDRIADLKYEIVFDKGILENHLTLESLDNASNEQVKNNLTKKDLSEIERYKQYSQAKITKITEKADKEPLTQDDIKTYEQWKTVNNSIVELEQTGVLAEKKKPTQEKTQKQSEPSPLEKHSKRLEPQENNLSRVVSPQAEKSLQGENNPHIEPKKINLAEKQQIIKEYAEKVQTTAKAILDSQLKGLREKAKPILEKYNTLKNSKPLMFGKDQWQKDTDNTLQQYNAMKTTHDSMKDKGVTDDHYKQAREHIANHEPSYHAQVQQAIKDLENHHQERQNQKAREHGADIYAQKGKTYRGEIVRADDKGILQQTENGIVYHPSMKGIEQGKSYTLTNKGDHYQTQQDYEIKISTTNQDKASQLDKRNI